VPYDLGDRQELAELWDMDSYCSDSPQGENDVASQPAQDMVPNININTTATSTDGGRLETLLNPYASLLTPFPTLFGTSVVSGQIDETGEMDEDVAEKEGKVDDDEIEGDGDDDTDVEMNEPGVHEDGEEDTGSNTNLNWQLIRAWHLFALLSLLEPECSGVSGGINTEKLFVEVMNVFSIKSPSVAPFVALLWLRSTTTSLSSIFSDSYMESFIIKFLFQNARSALELQLMHSSSSSDSINNNNAATIQKFESIISDEYETWMQKLPELNDKVVTGLCDRFLSFFSDRRDVNDNSDARLSLMQSLFFDSCALQYSLSERMQTSISSSSSSSSSSSYSFAMINLSCRVGGFWPLVQLLSQRSDVYLCKIGLGNLPDMMNSLMSVVTCKADKDQFRSCFLVMRDQSFFQSLWDNFFSTVENKTDIVLQPVISTINTFSYLFQSFLSNDYQPLLNAWHGGEAGVGQPLSQLAQNLLDSSQGLIRRLCNLSRRPLPHWTDTAAPSTSSSSDSGSPSYAYAPCSLSAKHMQSIASLLEFLQVQFLPQCASLMPSGDEAENDIGAGAISMLLTKLRHIQRELFSVLACASFEQLVGLVTSSIRSAIHSLEAFLLSTLTFPSEFKKNVISFVSVAQRYVIFLICFIEITYFIYYVCV